MAAPAARSAFPKGSKALVVELPQSAAPGNRRGMSQANFLKKHYEQFFGAASDGPAVHIELHHVSAKGELGERERRRSVSARRSGNWRFELNAAKGYHYPDIARGRPIGVFVRIAPHTFLYRLLMPGDAEHIPADELLTAPCGPYVPEPRHPRRYAELDADELFRIWPTNPLFLVGEDQIAALLAA